MGCVAMVGVEGWDESEAAVFGTVMYLEPSLLVYFAVFRGDAGEGVAGFWLVAGIVGVYDRSVSDTINGVAMEGGRPLRVKRNG